MRLVQLINERKDRRIARVEGNHLNLMPKKYPSIFHLVQETLNNEGTLRSIIQSIPSTERLDYQSIYNGNEGWKILPSFDHPGNPALCMISGTGLTHKESAEKRQKMHEDQTRNTGLTDSMKMYLWGEEGGKPLKGKIGIQPEWFYKGNGSGLRGHRDTLEVPSYGNDGGEEPEIAGVYIIHKDGTPVRVGFTVGNEFSDHIMEKKNYLYLAPSKLRNCSIGPELVLDHEFQNIKGKVAVLRNNNEIWSKELRTGEENIIHSLENMEYHHFKYHQNRIPGMVHIHFFGTSALSFGDGIALKSGDEMIMAFDGFGKPLRNMILYNEEREKILKIRSLY